MFIVGKSLHPNPLNLVIDDLHIFTKRFLLRIWDEKEEK